MKKIFLIGFLMLSVAVILVSCTNPSSEHEHVYGEWTVLKDATCTEPGEAECYCSCGERNTKVFPLLDHTEVIDEAVEPTCTETGLTEGKHCSVCNAVLKEQNEIPKAAHSYDDTYDKNCNKCGFVRDINCTHSDYKIIDGKDATCTESGFTESRVCVNCEEIFVEQTVVDALGHTESYWIIDEWATLDQEGLRHKVCTVCDSKVVEENYLASSGLKYTLNSDGTSYSVTGIGSCTDTDISITNIYNELQVTSIGNDAFKNCSSLISVNIPDSVISIGDYAFDNCTSLESVDLGNSLASIGSCAFYNCSSLVSINIPDSVTSIDSNAFYWYDRNTTGDGRQYNEYNNAYYLGNKNNPYHALISVKDKSVSNCEINNKTVVIAGNAFERCSSLTSIAIPDSVISIGSGAFYNCSSIKNIIIPDSVISIGGFAFWNCSSLTNITIPDSVTSIGGAVFRGCSSLESITIPFIGDGTGEETRLEYFECGNILKEITITGSLPIDSLAFNGKTVERVVIGDGVTGIGNEAFLWCSSLKSVVIGNGVTGIGNKAFSGCSSLTSVVIPDSVISVGDETFSGCSSLTSVVIGDGVTGIGNEAFSWCSSLKSIDFGSSVASIGDYAFKECSSLTSVVIGNGVIGIGNYAFYKCTSLENVTLGDSVTNIGEYAFNNCDSLTSVDFGNSPASIGDYAFYECASLANVDFGNVIKIGWNSFAYCTALTNIDLPDTLKEIGSSAFRGCNSLEVVNIPVSVMYVGPGAFFNVRNYHISQAIYFDGFVEIWWDMIKAQNKNGEYYNNGSDITVYCLDGKVTPEGKIIYN